MNKLYVLLVALVASLLMASSPQSSGVQGQAIGIISSIPDLVNGLTNLPYDILTQLFVNILPAALGFQPGNINGSDSQYMPFEFNDTSNEVINPLTTAMELITRAGFKYTITNATSDDGYITPCMRIINPKADQTKLKKYPFLMFHGGLIDGNLYLYQSNIQHHPEKYPRTAADGPITSSNRSLALMMSNNGYDVWICITRGANEFATGRTPAGTAAGPFPSTAYWRFKMDDISQKEVENQVNVVLNATGKSQVDMLVYSLSTMTSIQAFAGNPSFPRNKVHTYVLVAPVISNEGSSYFTKFLVRDLCIETPLDVGIGILSQLITTTETRSAIGLLTADKRIRYTVGKFLEIIVTGSSAQYLTFLETGALDFIFKGTGFGEMKQYCQQATAQQIQRYDYGPMMNLQMYNQSTPPAYNISQNFGWDYFYTISAGTDNLAPIGSVNRFLASLYRAPDVHNFIPGYNHQDIFAAINNNVTVNLPLLDFINSHQD